MKNLRTGWVDRTFFDTLDKTPVIPMSVHGVAIQINGLPAPTEIPVIVADSRLYKVVRKSNANSASRGSNGKSAPRNRRRSAGG